MSYIASVNIEAGFAPDFHYIITANARRAAGEIAANVQSGVHSFSVIGTYGTGKSSFILALENDLIYGKKQLLSGPEVFFGCHGFDIINIVGEYASMQSVLSRKLECPEGRNVLDELRARCRLSESSGQALLIFVDEFGKVLEHAAKNNPEEELYFLQKLAELVNDHRRKAILVTTLHQSFGAYATGLTESQRQEWNKVKGRYKDIVFSEPVEQYLLIAAEQMRDGLQPAIVIPAFQTIYDLAKKCHFITDGFKYETALCLSPMDPFAAQSLTLAIQRYGQNERSLFSFLNSVGRYSLADFSGTGTYNLSSVYDYLTYHFYSQIAEVNLDSSAWSAVKVAIGRVENGLLEESLVEDALKIVKAIGLTGILSNPDTMFSREDFYTYAHLAMGIDHAEELLRKLEVLKIIRFASYKNRYILFDGTDIDIEGELIKAAAIVPTPIPSVDELQAYIRPRIATASASYFRKGTPRYFEFILLNELEDRIPEGDIDGFCELLFPLDSSVGQTVQAHSAANPHAVVYAVFQNMEEIIGHLHEIKKLQYLLENIALDDAVASKEIVSIQDFEKEKLNVALNDSLFSGDGKVRWYAMGEECLIFCKRDFNRLLSQICDHFYPDTPVMKNELFNRQKLSSAISTAKSNLLDAVLNRSELPDLGFAPESFPPEKTIYLSLLKFTEMHSVAEDGTYHLDAPKESTMRVFWNACSSFVAGTSERPRKVGDLFRVLKARPFKMKQGFLEVWIPIYLFVSQQDYALYSSNGSYVNVLNREIFDLMQKNPSEFTIKAFNVTSVNMDFFRKYRQFLKKDQGVELTRDSFVEVYRPFIQFYRRLNEYAKSTRKFSNLTTLRFREVLAQATDPQKAFFDDLPVALGYKGINDDEFVRDYIDKIYSAIRELNSCYSDLIGRIESSMVEQLGLPVGFDSYKPVLEQRYGSVKRHLLPQKSKNFLERVLAPSTGRDELIEKLSASVMDRRLEQLKDKDEESLIDSIIYMFHLLDRYTAMSTEYQGESGDELFSFGLTSNTGIEESDKTFRLPRSQKVAAEEVEKKVRELLSGDNNMDVCVLLKVLADKMKN